MTVTLRPMQDADRPAVSALAVSGDQLAYVDPPDDTLARPGPAWEPFVIEADGRVIGCFHVDSSSGEQTIPDALEVHEVLIDASQQGKGYGKAFARALPGLLRDSYPGRRTACLTVNCKNPGAYNVYLHGGFVDTGEIYPHGRSGPQFIMRLDLGPS